MSHELIYVTSSQVAGIRREPGGKGFLYRWPNGARVADRATLARIRALAIPPAYVDVWICPSPQGHLQATGRDARGRKQYVYHDEWSARRASDKFVRLAAFGRALPRIRRRIRQDLATYRGGPIGLPVVLATLVRILDTTFIRVGNEVYARENRSYGLTSLRNRHASTQGPHLRLCFSGKRGIRHEVGLDDPRVARVVRRCKQLPGQTLFECEEDGKVSRISSGDVNDYLSAAASERFTAKEFRTWHGTVEALELIRDAWRSEAPFRPQAMLEAVAGRLGNTVAVCRKAYVHPAVLALAEQLAHEPAQAAKTLEALERARAPRGLRLGEARLLRLLARISRNDVSRMRAAA